MSNDKYFEVRRYDASGDIIRWPDRRWKVHHVPSGRSVTFYRTKRAATAACCWLRDNIRERYAADRDPDILEAAAVLAGFKQKDSELRGRETKN